VTEADYRALAARAAGALASASTRPPSLMARLPPWVGAIEGRRGLIADRHRATLELYPVIAGAVVEEGMAAAGSDALGEALSALRWPTPPPGRDDGPWLLPWLHGKRTGLYLDLPPDEPPDRTAARLRA